MDYSHDESIAAQRQYAAKFGKVPEGLARVAATNSRWDEMIAAMIEAVRTGREPASWTPIVWPRTSLWDDEDD